MTEESPSGRTQKNNIFELEQPLEKPEALPSLPKTKPKFIDSWWNAQGHIASYWWDRAWLNVTNNLKCLLNSSHSDNEDCFNLLPLEFITFSKSQEK